MRDLRVIRAGEYVAVMSNCEVNNETCFRTACIAEAVAKMTYIHMSSPA